jgi:hypothetical protein
MVTDPCNHYVIVEDNKASMQEWRTRLSPYYTRHHLQLISGTELLSSEHYNNESKIKNGWHRQAVLKLLIADKIQSKKYLILDSKNFFVHNQSLNDWPLQEGNGIVEVCDSYSWKEVDDFCLKNNILMPKEVYSQSTPYMVDTAIVKELIKFDILPLFFNKLGWWSSEFFLYSVFAQHVGNRLKSEPVPNITFWNTERKIDIATINDVYTWPNMKTFGLHRDILKLDIDITALVEFLIKIGFNGNIIKTALKQYKQDVKI